jgi:hypothetical protein
MSLVTMNWDPNPRQLRQFGLAALGFGLLLAGWLFWRDGWSMPVYAVGGCGVLLGLMGLAAPEMVRYPYLACLAVSYPVGLVMSQVLVAVIYFGVLTPVALVFRLIGRDALERRLEPAAATYWQPKARPGGPESYFRQF